MARQKIQARVLGPYPNRGKWRLIQIKKDGTRSAHVFATEKEANDEKERLTAVLAMPQKTIRDALKDYVTYMRVEKGNKERSVDQTKRKLSRFFPDLEVALTDLDENACAALYEALRTSKRKPQRRANGAPARVSTKLVSVDYHRNALSETKTFLNWCVKKGWMGSNPLARVDGVGRRNHGKEQLRINEARKWIARAAELAEREKQPGAVAAMMTLLMGMRCTEIVDRVVRDVDDDGGLLWIPDSKTKKGRRALLVPDVLRPHLLRLAEGRDAAAPLFENEHGRPFFRDWVRKWVQRICREVGVPVVTAHGQRGLHSTLAVEAGVTARAVADALGHESFATTAQSYARPEAVGNARQARVLRVLAGGKDEAARGAGPAELAG